jgi:hypothetical protein
MPSDYHKGEGEGREREEGDIEKELRSLFLSLFFSLFSYSYQSLTVSAHVNSVGRMTDGGTYTANLAGAKERRKEGKRA